MKTKPIRITKRHVGNPVVLQNGERNYITGHDGSDDRDLPVLLGHIGPTGVCFRGWRDSHGCAPYNVLVRIAAVLTRDGKRVLMGKLPKGVKL